MIKKIQIQEQKKLQNLTQEYTSMMELGQWVPKCSQSSLCSFSKDSSLSSMTIRFDTLKYVNILLPIIRIC